MADYSLNKDGLLSSSETGSVRMGMRDGAPICLGYFSVSFAFGIFATGMGLTVYETILMSMLNLTSAGQFAAVPIIAAGGSFIELAISQLVINARYVLMSLSLSQSMGNSVRSRDKFLFAFACADEPYAVAMAKQTSLSKKYFYSLIILPYLGWTLGTAAGSIAGNVLPTSIISALGIAIYAMFIAIIIPSTKTSGKVALAILIATAISCAFKYVPVLNKTPSGFVIIICTVLSSAIMALISLKDEEKEVRE